MTVAPLHRVAGRFSCIAAPHRDCRRGFRPTAYIVQMYVQYTCILHAPAIPGAWREAFMSDVRRAMATVLICQGCCCGHPEKGNPEIPRAHLEAAWHERQLASSVRLRFVD